MKTQSNCIQNKFEKNNTNRENDFRKILKESEEKILKKKEEENINDKNNKKKSKETNNRSIKPTEKKIYIDDNHKKNKQKEKKYNLFDLNVFKKKLKSKKRKTLTEEDREISTNKITKNNIYNLNYIQLSTINFQLKNLTIIQIKEKYREQKNKFNNIIKFSQLNSPSIFQQNIIPPQQIQEQLQNNQKFKNNHLSTITYHAIYRKKLYSIKFIGNQVKVLDDINKDGQYYEYC